MGGTSQVQIFFFFFGYEPLWLAHDHKMKTKAWEAGPKEKLIFKPRECLNPFWLTYIGEKGRPLGVKYMG